MTTHARTLGASPTMTGILGRIASDGYLQWLEQLGENKSTNCLLCMFVKHSACFSVKKNNKSNI